MPCALPIRPEALLGGLGLLLAALAIQAAPVDATPTAASAPAAIGAIPSAVFTGPAGSMPPVAATPDALPRVDLEALARELRIGDVVFIRVHAAPFRRVAEATGSWTNHVGIVVQVDGDEPVIAESTFPLSRRTPLSRFIARSENGRVEVARMKDGLDDAQRARLKLAVERRLGVFYDTGFDLHSRRQFCSRFVREVIQESTGQSVGEVETFAALLNARPDTDLGFWRAWYFGRIPWQRETVTPAAVQRSDRLRPVFDGAVQAGMAT